MPLSVSDLHDAFMEIGNLALKDGKVIDVAVYGGSALMIASNFRISTQDVDAVAEADQVSVDRYATTVAQNRGWPSDWLNDGVRTYLSPNVDGLSQHHELFRTYPSEVTPGMRVFVPSAEYLLAMKLLSMRIDPAGHKSDLNDILSLIDVVGLKSPEHAIAFAGNFYPEARVSGRLILGVREIWKLRDRISPRNPNEQSPQYLGRRR